MSKTSPFQAIRSLAVVGLVVIGAGAAFGGCTTVDPGHRGVQVWFGDLQQEVLEPGWHFKPLMVVEHISTQVQASNTVETAVTNDLQNVATELTLNWKRDPAMVRNQYENYPLIETRVIKPAIQESVKSVTANFTATDLVQRRQVVKDKIRELIESRLTPLGVIVDMVNITDFRFSNEFNQAIEAKVKAEQEALRARQELEKTKIVAEQAIAEAEGKKQAAILAAQGEAEAIRIQGKALMDAPMVLELRRIESWDGKMPQTMLGESGAGSVLISPK